MSVAVIGERSVASAQKVILAVEDLVIDFRTRHGTVRAVNGVSFELRAGETLGLVGESGSGKSVTSLAILGLLPRNATVVRGRVRLNGVDTLGLPEGELRKLRGRVMSMVLQDPMTSLNPVFTIGWQIGEAVRLISRGDRASVTRKVIDLLRRVRIPAPEARMRNYPHQMSGGMRQRSVGAIALAGPPQLLIADEPTTSLDATIQAQYLELLHDIQKELGLTVIFITHDFGIVAEICDRVAVMYAGRIVETADVFRLFDRPSHPYTRALLESVPQLGRTERLRSIPGQPPVAGEIIRGCPFAPRCPLADDRCRTQDPPRVDVSADHWALCWKAG
jgi:oligopeptide/dipeptide ABC transporter ATP-binding protein